MLVWVGLRHALGYPIGITSFFSFPFFSLFVFLVDSLFFTLNFHCGALHGPTLCDSVTSVGYWIPCFGDWIHDYDCFWRCLIDGWLGPRVGLGLMMDCTLLGFVIDLTAFGRPVAVSTDASSAHVVR